MKNKIPLMQAQELAQQIVESLKPCCQRIEIAGSIRRGKSEVGDIEIVAQPKFDFDLFGAPTENHRLDGVDWTEYGSIIKNGHKFKQIDLYAGISLDLFIVTPPAQWGVLFLIRTGSADFSHRFVTSKQHGGLLPSCYRVKDGAIWKGDVMIPTPEEMDVFTLAGVKYIAPESRSA
jgi:DNA polymerase/3'-5' exonuclease PolX